MKPMKSFVSLAHWLFRITVLLIVFHLYFHQLDDLNFTSVEWLISALLTIFAILLFIGAFLKNQSTTVVSGMILAILSTIMVLISGISLASITTHIPLIAIGLFFMGRGNRG